MLAMRAAFARLEDDPSLEEAMRCYVLTAPSRQGVFRGEWIGRIGDMPLEVSNHASYQTMSVHLSVFIRTSICTI